ncbi:MAG: acyl-[acyl-carrier-protein] thioesterase [Bacteroidales bacterium]
MEKIIYRKEYTVHVYETGVDEKLNPFSLFNYFQDIAAEHAVMLGFGREDLLKMNRFWILSRIAVEVSEWPLWKEKLVVITWPRGTEKMFAVRDFRIESADGRKIAAATSSWLIADINTKRIQRPGEHLLKYRSDLHDEAATGRFAGKIGPLKEFSETSASFRVRMSDLDINQHTNNAAYIKWIIDDYNLEFRNSHRLLSLEVNFLAESRAGDEIAIRTYSEDTRQYYHSVTRLTDNTELCRVSVSWKNCTL